MKTRLYLAVALILGLVLALTAETRAAGPSKEECALAGFKNPAQLTSFVANLRKAVKESNKTAVAEMVDYPIEIQVKDSFSIKDKAEFMKKFDLIITKAIREAVLEEPFINNRGVILLTGSEAQIWLLVTDGNLRIITFIIN
jgi:hypothetical protein